MLQGFLLWHNFLLIEEIIALREIRRARSEYYQRHDPLLKNTIKSAFLKFFVRSFFDDYLTSPVFFHEYLIS